MINGNSSLEQSAINSAVAAGFARVQEQVARAQEVRPRFEPLGYIDFLNLELPEREMLMAPWLPHKGLAMIYAWRGVGKTLLALSCAYAIASGAEILGWKPPRPARVVYIDGEMPARTMQDRLEAIKRGIPKAPPTQDYLRILSADLKDGIADLCTLDGQRVIDEGIGDEAELVIVDNLSTVARSAKENESDDWAAIQGWVLAHRRAGRSVLLIHHAGKAGAQRGTSRREDVLDTVIALRRPDGYTSDQGAKFIVEFEKARGLYGPDANPFEAAYREDNGGSQAGSVRKWPTPRRFGWPI